jgi:divalent metal cation (Fe/Co/Zn/Cd) transporter
VTVFAGLGLNFTLGWWWADPAVALVVAAITLWNGREAWREAGEREPSTLPRTSR